MLKELDKSVLINLLEEKGIKVVSTIEKDLDNKTLYDTSMHMGKSFNKISKIYEKIKRDINPSKEKKVTDNKIKLNELSFNIKNFDNDKSSSIIYFCQNLKKLSFLVDYKYSKKGIIQIKTNKNNRKAINYLTGGWFEIFLKGTVIQYLKSIKNHVNIEFTYLTNVQIEYKYKGRQANGELDVIFLINGKLFWIESKTGDYSDSIDKYSKIKEIMNLDKNKCFLTLGQYKNDNELKDISDLYKLTIVYITNFSDIIKNEIYNSFSNEDFLNKNNEESEAINKCEFNKDIVNICNEISINNIEKQNDIIKEEIDKKLGELRDKIDKFLDESFDKMKRDILEKLYEN